MRALGRVVLSACLALSPTAHALAAASAQDLDEGMALWRDGDLEGALLKLDAAARSRKDDPSRAAELALAHLYVGVVYVSLGQEGLGQSRFENALEIDGHLTLAADTYPAKVLRVFDAAKKSLADRLLLEREGRKKKGKGPLLLLGLGAAAAGGIALAISPKERANQAPSGSFQAAPAGEAIMNVTSVTFTASANDPEGEPLTYSWDFGDGGGATGASASHVYTREGTFTVVLTIRDGLTSTDVSGKVTVRSLTGNWQISPALFTGESVVTLTQQGVILRSPFMNCGPASRGHSDGGFITSPRTVQLIFSAVGSVACGACEYTFQGEVEGSLRQMTGTLSCLDLRGDCPCHGQQSGAALTRP